MPSEFESELADISYSYIQTKHQDILKYVIGYEISEYDEKESKGIGYFVLNINKEYFLVPTFFISGELKDIVHLYNKPRDLVYPLTEEWIDFFESRKTMSFGRHVEKPPRMERAPFDFRDIMNPSYATKYASDEMDFSEAEKVWAMQIKEASASRLVDFLKEANNGVKHLFLRMISDNKPLLTTCIQKYGSETVSACAPLEEYIEGDKDDLEELDEESKDMDINEKLAFMRDGYYIRDNRKMLKTAYDVDWRRFTKTPENDGIYMIAIDSGTKPALVAKTPFAIADDFYVTGDIVVDLDDKRWNIFGGDHLMTNYFVIEEKIKKEPHDLIEDIPFSAINKMKIGKTYMLYNHLRKGKKGCFSEPFEVKNKVKGKDGVLSFQVEPKYSIAAGSRNNTIAIQLREKDVLSRANNNDLFAPKTMMVVEIGEPNLAVIGSEDMSERAHQIMDRYDKEGPAIFKNGSFIGSIDISGEKDIVIKLARETGVPVSVIQDKVRSGKTFWVKKSQHGAMNPHALGEGPGVHTNALGGPYGMIPEHPTEHNELDILNLESGGSMAEGPLLYPKNDIQTLTNLSSIDNMKLFDEGMIGILSQMQGPGIIIKKYIPDLNKAVDKLGKLLMILWYHGYKVKTDFGLNEYHEFEEMLKDTFIHLGEIVLSLYKKDMSKKII